MRTVPKALPVILSRTARQSLSNIIRQTAEQWGKQQAELYITKIDAALQNISLYPTIGKIRDDLGLSLRSIAVKKHVIFYEVRAKHIRIADILHSKMDTILHIEE